VPPEDPHSRHGLLLERNRLHPEGTQWNREAIQRLDVGKHSLTALLYGDAQLPTAPGKPGPTLRDLAPSFGGARPKLLAAIAAIDHARAELVAGARVAKVRPALEQALGRDGAEKLLPKTLFQGIPWSKPVDPKPAAADAPEDPLTRKDRMDSAKEKFAGAVGRGWASDMTSAMQALMTLKPGELATFLADPNMQTVVNNLSPSDRVRVKQMASAKSPTELQARMLLWSFKGGYTGIGYDDKLFKSIVETLSAADRLEIDKHFMALRDDNPKGLSVEQMIDSEASLSKQNNQMMKAYWKNQGAAIGEELHQAAEGGAMRTVSDLAKRHPWIAKALTAASPLANVVVNGSHAFAGTGTNKDAYVTQLDKLRDVAGHDPDLHEQLVGQIDDQLGTQHDGMSFQKLNAQEGGNTTFGTMAGAAENGMWHDYSNHKAAAGAETTLGNRNWLHQEIRHRREQGDAGRSLETFLGGRSKSGKFDGYVDDQLGSKVDRGYTKMLAGRPAAEGSPEWIAQQAQRLLYAQFGGRTGWGDDRPEIESVMADLPKDPAQRKLVVDKYRELAAQQGLSGGALTQVSRLLGPVSPAAYCFLGNWSSGELGEDMQHSYGGTISAATSGIIGKGRALTQVEYDLAHGKATDADDQFQRATHMRKFDTESGWMGAEGMGVSGKLADERHSELVAGHADLTKRGLNHASNTGKPDLESMSPEQLDAFAKFNLARKHAESSAQSAAAVQRAGVDAIVTAVTTGVTIIVAAGITFVTAGTATPAVVAIASAAAGALTAMGAKTVLLGGKYSGNEAKLDFASAILDAVGTHISMGPALTNFANHVIGRLGVTRSVAQKFLTELLGNAAQSGVDLTKLLLDESMYQGSLEETFDRIGTRAARLTGSSLTSAAVAAPGKSKPYRELARAAIAQPVQAAWQIDPSKPMGGQILGIVNQMALGAGNFVANGGLNQDHKPEPPPLVDSTHTEKTQALLVNPTHTKKTEATPLVDPTHTNKTDATPHADPKPTIKTEATPHADPAPHTDPKPTIKTEVTPHADPKPTLKTDAAPLVDPTHTNKPLANATAVSPEPVATVVDHRTSLNAETLIQHALETVDAKHPVTSTSGSDEHEKAP